MNLVGGSIKTLGNIKRASPNVHNKLVKPIEVKATASGVPKNTLAVVTINPRRSGLTTVAFSCFCGRKSDLRGAGGTSSLGLAGFAGVSPASAASTKLRGPRWVPVRAAASTLAVSRGPTGVSGSVAAAGFALEAAGGVGFALADDFSLGAGAAPSPRAADNISATDIVDGSTFSTGAAGVSSTGDGESALSLLSSAAGVALASPSALRAWARISSIEGSCSAMNSVALWRS